MQPQIRLADFIADLRSDLALARSKAVDDAMDSLGRQESALWLEVSQVTLTVEVAHETSISGEVSMEAKGSFWVIGSAKVGGKLGGKSDSAGSQSLTLTLTPRLETIARDANDNRVVGSMSLSVDSEQDANERMSIPDGTGEVKG